MPALRGLSIRGQVLASLIGMSMAGVVIAGLAFALTAGPAFRQFMVSRVQGNFVHDLQTQYEENGTLRGVKQLVNPDDRNVPLPDVFFGLADASGTVVLPGDGYTIGAPAPADALRRGTPVRFGSESYTVLPPVRPVTPTDAQQAYARRINLSLALAALVAVGVSSLAAVALSAAIPRPVKRVTAAAARVAAGQPAQLDVAAREDELGRLEAAFAGMSADLARYKRAREQTVSDVVRELQQPLALIRAAVEAMRDGRAEPSAQRLDEVFVQSQQLTHVIDDLRLLSRAEVGSLPLERSPINLAEIVEASVRGMGLADVRVRAEGGGEVRVDADPGRLQQALDLLLQYAVRRSAPGQEVLVSVEAWPKSARRDGWPPSPPTGAAAASSFPAMLLANGGEAALVRVRDHGPRFSAETLAQLFDRYSAAPGDTPGSRLALAVVSAIVTAHGGSVSAANEPDGASFTICLPAGAPAPSAG
jgi:two-component system sensor histidine kinase BaeS